ncbi:chorismate lyase [Shewanella sp. NIFS-20-20]|uniref:chorismate--pyruvate lyase family protein n=1 Tax=Shewanella sp. NIFS-20-20 TaxID=2853806 RepID=UPI001C439E3A|nr:chorismate lyase [Shewanella sp. NIFS-20-20]MBV7316054.1 chorismate lyase [Shewanella sp. NIFS-20-20]
MYMTSQCFPNGESIQWFSPDKCNNLPSVAMNQWLTDKGSLTTRLRNCCQHFEVKLITHSQLSPALWVREVLLCLDGIPWVFAHTHIPDALMHHPSAQLASLGNRPLGEQLFAGDFIAGNIEIASVNGRKALARLPMAMTMSNDDLLWGRRRYFHLGDDTLIVSEIFLPKARAIIEAAAQRKS